MFFKVQISFRVWYKYTLGFLAPESFKKINEIMKLL